MWGEWEMEGRERVEERRRGIGEAYFRAIFTGWRERSVNYSSLFFPTLSMDLGTTNQRMQEISEFTQFFEKWKVPEENAKCHSSIIE